MNITTSTSGWHYLNGEWVYTHTGGAITTTGPTTSMRSATGITLAEPATSDNITTWWNHLAACRDQRSATTWYALAATTVMPTPHTNPIALASNTNFGTPTDHGHAMSLLTTLTGTNLNDPRSHTPLAVTGPGQPWWNTINLDLTRAVLAAFAHHIHPNNHLPTLHPNPLAETWHALAAWSNPHADTLASML